MGTNEEAKQHVAALAQRLHEFGHQTEAREMELWRLLGTDLRMGFGYHLESSGQVERFNQLLEQTLRCTIHQMAETRKWVDLLPVFEFAVNNTPNCTTGYTAFYLNYGFHPLHPLQLFNSLGETKNEFVVKFTSRL